MSQPNTRRPDGVEWNAAVYHRVAQPHVSWGAKVLARLHLRGDETVLDAGCGTGRLTAELLELLPQGRVIAFDRSQNMLDKAREELEPRFGDRVRYVQGDLQTIGTATIGESVDVVFSTATFHWLSDHPHLFAGLFALLRHGGRLEAQCGGGPNIAAVRTRAGELMASPPYAPFFAGWSGPWHFADDVTTADRLRDAGFVDVATTLEEAPTLLPDAATYHDFLRDVVFGSHLARIPDDDLRHTFVDTLTRQAAGDDPPFALDYWRLNMSARKP
ncbi:MAG: trans-aconitate 2-methyltransferase [Thermomicrobiales bacterium]|nr:trans-aconitate 2-methyltransferase [Thermomicrobiales bacterium]